MLGIKRTAPGWKWTAFGKHPAAGDYFYAGPKDSLFQAFSGWVENGFQGISARKKSDDTLYSWRFCGKSPTQDILLCGVGRDSCDRVGRPYPLFIMGAGALPGFSRYWDLLPFALEIVWSRMEYMCAKRYIDFSQIEADTQRLPPPESDWTALAAEREKRWAAWRTGEIPDSETIRRTLRQYAGAAQYLVPFADSTAPDVTSMLGLWFSLMKTGEKDMFATAFLGGTVSDTRLAIFRRPLAMADFAQLWSANTPACSEPTR